MFVGKLACGVQILIIYLIFAKGLLLINISGRIKFNYIKFLGRTVIYFHANSLITRNMKYDIVSH